MSKAFISLFIISVIFSLISFSYSQVTYAIYFANNDACQPTEVGSCIPCQVNAGSEIYYYQITRDINGFDAYSFKDSFCTQFNNYTEAYEGPCPEPPYYYNCQFFVPIESISTISLTLSSTEPVVVSLLGEDNPSHIQISSNKVSAQGGNLAGVQVQSEGTTFYVEKRVSSTQYSSNIGIFTLGETYTHTPFTFTVTTSEIDLPFPPLESDQGYINFSPFTSAQVTDENTYSTYHFTPYEVVLYVDNGNYNLEGLVLTNEFYSIQNMTFFPPYQQYGTQGELVFQFESSNSPIHTLDCQLGVSYITSYEIDFFECEIGSIISTGNSKNPGEITQQKIRQPDEMSFSLF